MVHPHSARPPVSLLAALCACLVAACGGAPGPTSPPPPTSSDLVIDVRAMAGAVPATLPLKVPNTSITITGAAVWLYGVGVVSDRGAPAQPQIDEVPYTVGDPELTTVVHDSLPAFYSAVQLELAPPDPDKYIPPSMSSFAGQPLASRVAGTITTGSGSSRDFVISDADRSLTTIKASMPALLQPGAQLHVGLDTDVLRWLQGIPLQALADATPAGTRIEIGPANSTTLTLFRANVVASFSVALTPAPQ